MMALYSGLRILMVAAVDDAAHSHNRLRRRALERLGCTVEVCDPDQPGFFERLVRRGREARVRAALSRSQSDAVLVIGEQRLDGDGVEALREGSQGRWALVLDEEPRSAEAARRAAMAYDHVFVASTQGVRILERHGVKHATYLAQGCDPSVHKPLRARGVFRSNVVFAGWATPRREELLAELVEFGLAVWGPGWRKTSLKDYCRGELPGMEDFVRAYAGASVAVNIHRTAATDPARDGTGLNQRTFELAAIGVTQVVDARGDLAQHFEEGEELLTYSTAEQLRGQVKRALQEDRYRDRLATAARHRALREHTYMHRMADLLARVTGRTPP
jgi:spore maturation protein CgeB